MNYWVILFIGLAVFALGNVMIFIFFVKKKMEPDRGLGYVFLVISGFIILFGGAAMIAAAFALWGVYGNISLLAIGVLILLEYGVYKLLLKPAQEAEIKKVADYNAWSETEEGRARLAKEAKIKSDKSRFMRVAAVRSKLGLTTTQNDVDDYEKKLEEAVKQGYDRYSVLEVREVYYRIGEVYKVKKDRRTMKLSAVRMYLLLHLEEFETKIRKIALEDHLENFGLEKFTRVLITIIANTIKKPPFNDIEFRNFVIAHAKEAHKKCFACMHIKMAIPIFGKDFCRNIDRWDYDDIYGDSCFYRFDTYESDAFEFSTVQAKKIFYETLDNRNNSYISKVKTDGILGLIFMDHHPHDVFDIENNHLFDGQIMHSRRDRVKIYVVYKMEHGYAFEADDFEKNHPYP